MRSSATRSIYYERRPELDKRIAHGDDYAGDAWVRWTAPGQEPEDIAHRPTSTRTKT